jgi:hypothetical protein
VVADGGDAVVTFAAGGAAAVVTFYGVEMEASLTPSSKAFWQSCGKTVS